MRSFHLTNRLRNINFKGKKSPLNLYHSNGNMHNFCTIVFLNLFAYSRGQDITFDTSAFLESYSHPAYFGLSLEALQASFFFSLLSGISKSRG